MPVAGLQRETFTDRHVSAVIRRKLIVEEWGVIVVGDRVLSSLALMPKCYPEGGKEGWKDGGMAYIDTARERVGVGVRTWQQPWTGTTTLALWLAERHWRLWAERVTMTLWHSLKKSKSVIFWEQVYGVLSASRREKVWCVRMCVCVCNQRSGDRIWTSPHPMRALPNIMSLCVSRKRNVLIGEHHANREGQLARGSSSLAQKKSSEWIYLFLGVCVYTQLVQVKVYSTAHREMNAVPEAQGTLQAFAVRCMSVCQTLDAYIQWQRISNFCKYS